MQVLCQIISPYTRIFNIQAQAAMVFTQTRHGLSQKAPWFIIGGSPASFWES